MKILKFLMTIALLTIGNLIATAQSPAGSGNNSGGNTTITIPTKPKPPKESDKGPKDPTQSPLTCVLMGDCLSVFCHYDAIGEVSVFNNETMETIATESGNLGEGIILILDNYTLGSMSLTVTMSGTTYVGNF